MDKFHAKIAVEYWDAVRAIRKRQHARLQSLTAFDAASQDELDVQLLLLLEAEYQLALAKLDCP